MMQYDQHLTEVLALRGQNGHFAAHDYFHTLPPAGRMPAASIDPGDFSQLYFPSQVDVELSIVAEDELPALLEESLLLQPIDLTQPDELASTSVLVLLPKPRNELRKLEGQLKSLVRTIRPVAPGLVAKRAPMDVLRGLLVMRPFLPVLDPNGAIDAAWRAEMAGATLLYYVRRRHLNYKASIAGVAVAAGRDEILDEQQLASWIGQAGEPSVTLLAAVKSRATAPAIAELTYWLSSPVFQPMVLRSGPRPGPFPESVLRTDTTIRSVTDVIRDTALISPRTGLLSDARIIPPPLPIFELRHPMARVFLRATVFDLSLIPPTVTRAQVLDVEGRYLDADFGTGTARFAAGLDQTKADALVEVLAQTGQLPAFDKVARTLSDTELADFKTHILDDIMAEGPTDQVGDLGNFIVTKLREIES
jgi:hypothetical protein